MTRQSDIINANFKFLDNKIKEIELFKSPNVIIQGNPTITNGQVTGLSKTDYLILPFEFDVKDRGFELTYCFRTGADVTTPQNLYGSKFSIASYVSGGKLTIRVSSNGTSWNVLDLITDLDIQPNTTYYIKLIFNRLSYTVKYSTDGVEYTQINNVVNPNAPAKGDIYLGIGNNQNNPFLGMLNLHKWELKFNNSVFWEGMDDAGLATRADISLSNLDEIGEKRFTDIHDALDTKQPVGDYATNTALTDGLATKQDVINDLATIRDNAQAGKNASDTIATYGNIVTHNANEFQPAGDYATNTALTQGLATKQDVIDDLEEIRSNAQDGKNIIPQVEVNTQRIEELTTAKFPNVIIKGTPHIVGGQVSGFTNTNYLQFPFVDISHGRPFKFRFSFTTGDNVTRQQNILDSYFGLALAIQNSRGIMALSSNGSTWDIGMATGTVDLSPRTTYYVEYGFTGTEYTTAISLNKESYVPDMILPSDKKLHITTTYIGGSPDLFGVGTSHPFDGSINFNDSEVEVQTDLGWLVVWEGMADVGFATRANVSLSNLDEAGEARFDAKANVTDLTAHTSNETIHVTASDKIAWSQKVNQDQLLGYGSELDYADDTLSLLNTAGETLSSVNIKSTPNLDNSTISLNASNKLQAIGVIEKNKGLAKYDWVGTLEEYETQNVETLHPDWICYITDDVSGGASVYTKDETYSKSQVDNAISSSISLAISTMLSNAYPVGSVYITTAETCPLSALISGSTWELVSSGRVLQGADNDHTAGTTIEAGLPNITGYVISSGVVINSSTYPAKSGGALYLYGGGYKNNSMGSSNDTSGVGIDASRSSSIYGNSTTVQPPAYVVNIFERTA